MRDNDRLVEAFTTIAMLRTELSRVTEALETLIAEGFPMRPMSSRRDGVDEWEKWHLDMEKRIADAQKALAIMERLSPKA